MKDRIVKFPGVLNYSILVTILGVVWSDPMEVVSKGEIGKVFEPWFISLVPLIACVATIISSYLKDMSVTMCNKSLILIDFVVFGNIAYLLYSKDFRSFIIINTITFILIMIFGRAYGMKMKDVVAKVFPENNLKFQAKAARMEGVIRFLVLLGALAINLLFVEEDPITNMVNYDAIIYYALVMGVGSIGYEIWYMKPIKYLNIRYQRVLRDLERKKAEKA